MNDEIWTYPESVGRLDVTGYDVEALDGDIGTVDETSLEMGAGYLVIDTGRWIFGKKVLIPAGLVDRVDRDGEKVYLSRAKNEIESAPEFDKDAYTEPAYREKIGAYYSAGAVPPERAEGAPTGWAAVKEGFAYLKGRRVLQSTFYIDLIAMPPAMYLWKEKKWEYLIGESHNLDSAAKTL